MALPGAERRADVFCVDFKPPLTKMISRQWHIAYGRFFGVRRAPRSASGHLRQFGDVGATSAFALILLQKSFWEGERKFLELLMRFTRGEVRDHIASSKIDHGPP